MTVNNETGKISLREFMERNPGGIGVNHAVAMLMPVAEQLRDLHNNGYIHLEVSPHSVFVGADGAVLYGTTSIASNRCTNGFAAPEIYQGGPFGYGCDVYSFCAVLSFAAFGNPCVQWVQNTADPSAAGLCEILRRGMMPNVADRIASMQEVIAMLSSCNVPVYNAPAESVPVQNESVQDVPAYNAPAESAPVATAQETPTEGKKKKSKIPAWVVIMIAAAVLIVVLAGTYVGLYIGARNNARNGDFKSAESLLLIPQITKIHDADLVAYVDAGLKLKDEKYIEAKDAFVQLPGYMSADELALEADYQYALVKLDEKKFDEAIAIMTGVSNSEYKDSADKILEFRYKKAVYLLEEESDFAAADTIFTQLAEANYNGAEQMRKETQYRWAISLMDSGEYVEALVKLLDIAGYSDVGEVLEDVQARIYEEGVALYESGKYKEAKELLLNIESFKEVGKYIVLIDAHRANQWTATEELVESLIDIIGFEDAADLLLSNDDIGQLFLTGDWVGGDYYFTMKTDGSITYNLPWFEYGDYYSLEDGKILLYPRNNMNASKPLFRITVVSRDCIKVFCYSDSETYTLYRQ